MTGLIIKVWHTIKKIPPVFKFLGVLIPVIASLITIYLFVTSHIPPHEWIARLQDNAPTCETDSVNKPLWTIPDGVKSTMSLVCSPINGLEVVPSPRATLAEFDLDRINGQPYNQNELDVNITVNFGDIPDSNTMAGLVVQTPQHGIGGYGLAINNKGFWELVNNNQQREASGNVKTQSVYQLELKVDEGKIYGWINGEQVFAFDDTSTSSNSAIGLIIFNLYQYDDGTTPPLASVYFSNFVLKL